MRVLQILLLIVGLAVFVNAQNVNLTGRIFDLNGAVIPNIKVVAVSQSKIKYEQITDGDGIYLLSMPIRNYDFQVNDQTETKKG